MLRAWTRARTAPSRSSSPPARADAWARSTNPSVPAHRGQAHADGGGHRRGCLGRVRSLVVVAPAGWEDYAQGCVEFCGRPAVVVTGGDSRQASVRAALAADRRCPGRRGARCGQAVRRARSVHRRDRCDRRRDDRRHPRRPGHGHGQAGARRGVVGTVDREELALAQTPQAFATEALRAAHDRAVEAGLTLTDDAAVLELAGHQVRAVRRRPDEHEDHHPLRSRTGRSPDGRRGWLRSPRVGIGFDVHPWAEGGR